MRFATTKNTLKEKVGSGGIPEERIKRAEEVIEKCDVGFSSYIHKSVEVMCDIIATEHTDDLSETKRQLLIKEVMTMKAHGKMFSFPLVSALSNEVLQIFDIAQRVNADLIDIIKVYIQSLQLIADNQIQSYSNEAGQSIAEALCAACGRYVQKYG